MQSVNWCISLVERRATDLCACRFGKFGVGKKLLELLWRAHDVRLRLDVWAEELERLGIVPLGDVVVGLIAAMDEALDGVAVIIDDEAAPIGDSTGQQMQVLSKVETRDMVKENRLPTYRCGLLPCLSRSANAWIVICRDPSPVIRMERLPPCSRLAVDAPTMEPVA